MKIKSTYYIIYIVLFFPIIFSCNSKNDDLKNIIKGIYFGREFAYYLHIGNKEELLNIADINTKEKILNIDINECLGFIEYEKYFDKVSKDLLFPLLPEKNDIELIYLEKIKNVLIMTFGYRQFFDYLKIPNKGYLFYTVAIRFPFYLYSDKSKGKLEVIDFYYTYNLGDYCNWLVKNGEIYSKKRKRNQIKFYKSKNITNELRRKLFNDIEKFSLLIKTETKTQTKNIYQIYSKFGSVKSSMKK